MGSCLLEISILFALFDYSSPGQPRGKDPPSPIAMHASPSQRYWLQVLVANLGPESPLNVNTSDSVEVTIPFGVLIGLVRLNVTFFIYNLKKAGLASRSIVKESLLPREITMWYDSVTSNSTFCKNLHKTHRLFSKSA